MKVVISEFLDSSALDRFRDVAPVIAYEPDLWRHPARLRESVHDADALVVRNQTQVNRAVLTGATRLKAVARLGVGLDNIDVDAAKEKGVREEWPRGANAIAGAEFVLLYRNLDAAARHVREGGWSRLEFGGLEIAGRRLGLVGLGEIGLRVATRASALGLEVWAADPVRIPDEAAVQENRIRVVPLNELLASCEILSLHAPLTSETANLLNRKSLQMVPAGASIVNTARGGLVDSLSLAEALNSGHIGGAVLDVTEPEPLPPDHPLRRAPNVWLTPHIAGLTEEAQQRITSRVAADLRRILSINGGGR